DGHAFWDTETFVLPVLTYTRPEVAADVLRWRASILHHAVERAATRLDLGGAAFPWRTISGVGSSGYWPAGAAAVHVNADIAGAALQYLDATQDDSFETEVAVPLLVGTARLWASLGYYGPDGQFHIDGVTGPDEYSALADDNVYTNLGAKKNLAAAAELCARHPDHAAELGVSEAERCRWTKAAQQMAIPFDAHLGVHPQAHRFTEQQTWDFASTRTDQYPLMLHFPYLELYRKQVVKQADLVLAMQLHPDEFTDEQKAANFAYYEAITVRDSSLSASTQAVIAAEVGHLELAYDYLGEAALMDLKDLEHNTRDGLHMAALAGAWTVLVVGFGRMRPGDGRLRFSPRLPASLSRIAFRICYRDRRLQVEILPRFAIYRLTSGQPLEISHHGQIFELASEAVTLPIPDGGVSRKPPPGQPSGRAPAHRLGVKNPDLNDSGAQRESEP
ncbi:MAG: hypothetical protein J2O47_09765, partial [Acidimicrobiaceae bacterium]|nr:hypothetical protein [Acidimicrobiaceae bacterium]